MGFCIKFQSDLFSSLLKNNQYNDQNNESTLIIAPTINDYRNDLFQIVKDAEELNKSDESLIEYLTNLSISDELKPKLKDFRTGYDDFTLLHVGAKFCRKKFCSFLIQFYQIDKDILSKSRLTPLQVLIKNNTIQIANENLLKDEVYLNRRSHILDTFKIFIDLKSNINNQDENGYSLLHYAALRNNYDIAVELLKINSINISIEDKKKFTPLLLALKHDCNEVASLLIDHTSGEKLSCYKVPNSILPVHKACRSKEEKINLIRKMLNKIGQESKPDRNLLEYVLTKEDTDRQTLVHIAINNNHLNIVEALFKEYHLDKDIREGKYGNLAIHNGAKNGSVKILDILERYDGVSFGQNNNLDNALHIATENNSFKFVREFLIYERNMINRVETDRNFVCACICSFSSHIPSVRVKNKKHFTPLMSGIVYGNHKCVEELLNNSTDVELDCKDIDGNTIYHLCAQFNNLETLKFFLQKYFNKTSEILNFRNCQDDTLLHVACRFGNLEVIKIVLQKIYDSNSSADTLLYSQNMNGQTCFHLACIRGFFNIVEYFLRDKKLTSYLEHVDNNSNTSLHLATENGHSSIVSLLLENGADVTAKNESNLTALDLSCRLGYFEISKSIIHKYSKMSESQTALHTAAQEGAHEVVKLLLLKGAIIDKLDENKQNCLGLAVSRGQSEVVKVLLQDKNWQKLIRLNNFEDPYSNITDETISVVSSDPQNKADIELNQQFSSSQHKDVKLIENPELYLMFEKKMWDNFKIILDRCIESDKVTDFTKIDMPVESVSKHPLMLIARSGQEDLLKHKTVTLLLNLKWRIIPRSAFYISILFHLFFLTLLTFYSLELANAGAEFKKEIESNLNVTNDDEVINLNELDEDLIYYTDNFVLFGLLIITMSICLMKELLQFLLLDGFSYFFYLQNIVELLTYFLGFFSLFASNYSTKSACASISVLLAFLIFPLHIQKLRVFGVYVVAFCRTLMNSAKFFPIFIIIYIGFLLSFRLRSNFGVSYFESTVFSLVRTLTMVTGELDTIKMGLTETLESLPNYIIYLMFIGLMCTILINLFVGIAVGEIKTVLDEADIQQISMRIMFVLKVQSALQPFRKTYIGKYLDMSFTKYDSSKENEVTKLLVILRAKVLNLISSKDPEIKLLDPQKRLEDSFIEMSRNTIEQIKTIKSLFNNQVGDVETKLNNSQIRVEDGLNEMARNTTSYMENLIEEMNKISLNLTHRIDKTERLVEDSIVKQTKRHLEELNFMKFFFDDKINKIEAKLDNLILDSFNKTSTNFSIQKSDLIKRFNELEDIVKKSEEKVYEQIDESSDFLNKELKEMKHESIEVIKFEVNRLQTGIINVQESIVLIGNKLKEIEIEKKEHKSMRDKDRDKDGDGQGSKDLFYYQS